MVADFCWTTFASRYAIGSDQQRPQTVPWEECNAPFTEYVRQHLAFASKVVPKDQSPGIIHGKTNGYRGARDVLSCTALVLDCDGAPQPPYALIESLRCAYLCQWRRAVSADGGDVVKWHLVLPLVRPLEPHEIAPRRRAAIKHFEGVVGVPLDRAMEWPAAMLHPYCRRTAEDAVPTTWSGAGDFFDLDALTGQDWVHPTPLPATTPRQRTAEFDTVEAAMTAAGWFLDVPRRRIGRPIRCPFNHPGQGQSSTVFADDGRIICLHGSCKGRAQAEWLAQLPLTSAHLSPLMRAQLAPRPGPEVTVAEAHDAMRGELTAAKPFRR